MPPPSSTKIRRYPSDIVQQIAVGEMANQGPEGMKLFYDTLVNRAAGKRSLEEVATEPAQFSAFNRPDLTNFYLQQPVEVRTLANQLYQQAQQPDYQPTYPTKYYVTKDLWKNRNAPSSPSWLQNVTKVGEVGSHVLLAEKSSRR